MSRKFRWFVLASCAFVVLMGGREAINLLAGGPQVRRSSPEHRVASDSAVEKRVAKRAPLPARLGTEGELARGEAQQPHE